MYQNHIRFFLPQDFLHSGENGSGDIRQILTGFHDRQVIIRYDPENVQHLPQHLPVLTAHAHLGVQKRTFFQFQHQRAHFDCFRSGSKNHQDLFHILFLLNLLIQAVIV